MKSIVNPKIFCYATPIFSLAAGASPNIQEIEISSDADFLLHEIRGNILTDAVTVNILLKMKISSGDDFQNVILTGTRMESFSVIQEGANRSMPNFPLRFNKPIRIPADTLLLISFDNNSTAESSAYLQLQLWGYKVDRQEDQNVNNLQLWSYKVDRQEDQNVNNFLGDEGIYKSIIKPGLMVYEIEEQTLTAGQTLTPQISLGNDADFLVQEIRGVIESTAGVESDTRISMMLGGGELFNSVALAMETFSQIQMIAGTTGFIPGYPVRLPACSRIPARSNINVQIFNNSAATILTQLQFWGYKVNKV